MGEQAVVLRNTSNCFFKEIMARRDDETLNPR